MYLGHIIFLAGLALLTRSRLAWLIAIGTAWWFNRRVEGDEAHLRDQFGGPYLAYRQLVRRWLPRLPNPSA
jgi:protein-S-isoprenylcysteine O-methyltransferase Ste14